MIAVVSFSSLHWLVPALLLITFSIVLAVWSYRAIDARARLKRQAIALKLVALCLLGICLIEPVWSGVQAKPHSNHFIVLADNSQSLNIRQATDRDAPSLAERFDKLLDATQPQHWLERLGQDFSLHQTGFDRRLRPVSEFKQLEHNGEQSALKSAWTSLQQRFQGQPVGGVLLFSDGNATDVTLADLESQAAEWKKLGPCYPVVVDETAARPDVAINSVSVSETSFEDAPVTVTCDVRASGLKNATNLAVACQLIGTDGGVLEDQTIPLTDGEHAVFRFQAKPTTAGLSFYAIEAVLVPTKDGVTPPDEITLANNRRLVQLNRGAEKHRVLYISGRPNWEFKFLRRAVEDDSQIDLVGMIRIAKREAKFDFRGRDGQSSNALFRGFKKDSDEETERFDEAVIVRLNTKTPDELRAGFPKEAKELFGFEAIVMDDVEASFFTHDQLALIGRFVSERGGGLLMLGGPDSYGHGGYERSPVADALPVYLDRAKPPPEDSALRLNLTREGWLQTWTRLRSTEADEQLRLKDVASFKALNSVRGIKPGASVLATVTDGSGTHWPALVTQQYGRGHVGSLLIGDLWRSQIKATEASRGDLAKAWRQTVRWLISDVPQRLQVTTEPATDFAADAVRVRIKAVDAEYRPLDNARLKVTCSGPLLVSADADPKAESTEKSETVLTAEAMADEPGVYSTVFVPRGVGSWKLSLHATDGDGEELPTAEAGWVHDPLTAEFQNIGTQREFLEKLASVTGGRVVAASELDSFVSALRHQPMPVTEAWTMPLWDHPLVFACVLACLLGEWALRRIAGIA